MGNFLKTHWPAYGLVEAILVNFVIMGIGILAAIGPVYSYIISKSPPDSNRS